GRLVANESGRHPYQTIVPDEYENRSRWFLLETSVDPPQFKLYTHVPVFALALVKGNAPKREWLIYAHAPMGDRKNVEITVPGYGKAVGDVSVGGTFIRVKE